MRDVLDRIFHDAYGFFGVLKGDGTLLRANRAALAAAGLQAEEVRGVPLWDTPWWAGAPAAARDALRAAVGRAAGGEPVYLEVRGPEPARWLDVTMRPLTDEDGRVDLVVVDVRDITPSERLAAEQTRDAALVRAVLDTQTELVSRLRVDGALLFVNDAYCQFFGVSREQLIGRSYRPVAVPDDIPAIEDGLARISPDAPVVVIENRVVDGQGRVRWMEFVDRGFFDPQGALVEIQSIGRDLTERRRGEQERLAAERRLQELQRFESLGLLAGGVAHDFNNILASITASAGLARHALGQAPALEFIAEIEQAAARAAELCQQMLAYAGKSTSSPHVEIDTGRLVRELVPLLRPVFTRGVEVSLELDDPPPILGDPTQLRQVLLNLVVNAAEACAACGRVTISARRRRVDPGSLQPHPLAPAAEDAEFVSVTVRDNGAGMSADTQARMFEPFFTTKSTGRGLGLSVTLGIVRAHGGTLTVDSAPGRGTSFELLFPAVGRRREPTPVPRPSAGLALVVDDDEAVRRVLTRALGVFGYAAVQAGDGAEALALFASTARRCGSWSST
jgi:PAS domain S-box-containing protein